MERRHIKRKLTLIYLDVINSEKGGVIGHLADISDDGLMLIVDAGLELPDTMPVRIHIPDHLNMPKAFAELEIEFRWSRPDQNPKYLLVGCLFRTISDKDRTLLKDLQEVLTFDSAVSYIGEPA